MWIFRLSTPFCGVLKMLISYDQSTGRIRTAAVGSFLRNAAFLLPVTLALGIFLPSGFWWVFLITEVLSLAVLLPVRDYRRKKTAGRGVPVMSVLAFSIFISSGLKYGALFRMCST